MIESLIKSLFLTLLIELIVCIIFGIRKKEDIIVVICANVCTNPIVVYIANLVLMFSGFSNLYWIVVAILEIFAVILEAIIYKKCLRFNKFSAFTISLICNIISFGIGLLI